MTNPKKREAAPARAAISTNSRTVSSWSVQAARFFSSRNFLDRPLTTERHTLTVCLGDIVKGGAR